MGTIVDMVNAYAGYGLIGLLALFLVIHFFQEGLFNPSSYVGFLGDPGASPSTSVNIPVPLEEGE